MVETIMVDVIHIRHKDGTTSEFAGTKGQIDKHIKSLSAEDNILEFWVVGRTEMPIW